MVSTTRQRAPLNATPSHPQAFIEAILPPLQPIVQQAISVSMRQTVTLQLTLKPNSTCLKCAFSTSWESRVDPRDVNALQRLIDDRDRDLDLPDLTRDTYVRTLNYRVSSLLETGLGLAPDSAVSIVLVISRGQVSHSKIALQDRAS